MHICKLAGVGKTGRESYNNSYKYRKDQKIKSDIKIHMRKPT